MKASKSSNIKVAVRIRPILSEEMQKGLTFNRDNLAVQNSTNIKYVL